MIGQLLDRLDRVGILRGHKGNRDAGGAATAGPADAVNIIIRMPGHVEIEDVADTLDIEPACRNVGSDKDVDITSLEAIEFAQPLGLLHVAMNLAGTETITAETLGQIAHRRLAVAEHQRAGDNITF